MNVTPRSFLPLALRQRELALRRRHAQLRGAHVRALPERHRFQVVLAKFHRLVFEVSYDFIGFGHGLVAKQLPQAGQRLNAGQLGRRDIHLELQQLQLDLQQVASAHGAGLEGRLADVHGLLETRQILLRQIQIRLREQRPK